MITIACILFFVVGYVLGRIYERDKEPRRK